MKELVGKRVEFVLDGFDKPFTAKVVEDQPSLVLVKGEKDTRPRRIVKSKIVMFTPMEDVDADSISLLVLACDHPATKCPGVRFAIEGQGAKRSDFDKFMAHCPRRTSSCRCSIKGELRSLSGETLRDMLDGVVFGEYPEAT